MPLYTYQCLHGHRTAVFRKIDKRDEQAYCDTCPATAIRIIEAPFVRPDYPGYESPATGKWVEGRKAHKEDLARSGCRILEPGETQAFQRRKAREDEAFLDRIADSAAATVMQMSAAKREQLAKELESGADVSYSRSTL